MNETKQFIKILTLSIVAVYIVIAGIFAIFGVLGWTAWELIGEWLATIALVAVLVVVISGATSYVLRALRK